MRPDETYQLLRNLTSPIVAITSERGGKRNGMISDSAVRASIVPAIPRVSVYIHKFNLSHDLILDRKSTRLNSSHLVISYAVFCLKKKKSQEPMLICVHLS